MENIQYSTYVRSIKYDVLFDRYETVCLRSITLSNQVVVTRNQRSSISRACQEHPQLHSSLL
jgi:hypothetical protein